MLKHHHDRKKNRQNKDDNFENSEKKDRRNQDDLSENDNRERPAELFPRPNLKDNLVLYHFFSIEQRYRNSLGRRRNLSNLTTM